MWHDPIMTKGQAEAAITEAITRFKREFLGRGPQMARTWIMGDMILVRLEGVLSRAETQLSKDPEGVILLKKMRTKLIEGSGAKIKEVVESSVGMPVKTMHTDVSSRTGESVFVFTMQGNLEKKFDG